jgi:Predicted ATPase
MNHGISSRRYPDDPDALARAGVTTREREVLACLVARFSNREIAERLGCTVRTVESHVSALLGKLGAPDRIALARLGASLQRDHLPSTARIPRPLTSFVGRGPELAQLGALLAGGRLVTLVGAPGVGKTRLAIEFAHGEVDARRFDANDVVFCDLTTLADDGAVADLVLAAVGASPAPDRTAQEALGEVGRDRRLLLILDNCEHVADEAAATVESVLSTPGDIRVLATSREPIGVDGEVTLTVPVLAAPPPGSPASFAAADAVRLFVDRARAARPDLRFEPRDAETVAEICRRLDGLPLAIELAAPRVRAFSLRQLGAALDDILGAAPPEPRPGAMRRRTLHASIEWSHRTLEPAERLLFRRLSVFVGPATPAAVEAVCAFDDLASPDILATLASLVDRSLVEAVAGPGDDRRFRLLFPIRSFAREEAATSGELEALRRRHAGHFADRAEAAEPHLVGPDAPEWAARVRADVDDIRAALDWSGSSGELEPGLRIVAALGPFWGEYDRRREWMERVVGLVSLPGPTRSVIRARALVAASDFMESWDPRLAVAFGEEAIELAEAIGDERLVARARAALGWLLARTRDRAVESRRLLKAASAWFVAAGDVHGAAKAEFGLSRGLRGEAGIRHLLRAKELFARVGDELGVANALYLAGESLVRSGRNLDRAEAMLLEAVERAPRHGSEWETAHARSALGQLGIVRGNDPDAHLLIRAALPAFRFAGDVNCTARCEGLLGVAAWRSGDAGEAVRAFRAAMAAALRVDDRITLADSLDGIAALQPADRDRLAIVLHAAAARFRREAGPIRNLWKADYAVTMRARAVRAGSTVAAARAEGALLTPADAARLALAESGLGASEPAENRPEGPTFGLA